MTSASPRTRAGPPRSARPRSTAGRSCRGPERPSSPSGPSCRHATGSSWTRPPAAACARVSRSAWPWTTSTWTGACCTSSARSRSSAADSCSHCRRAARHETSRSHRPSLAGSPRTCRRSRRRRSRCRGRRRREPVTVRLLAYTRERTALDRKYFNSHIWKPGPAGRRHRAQAGQRDGRPAPRLRLGAAGRGGEPSGRCRSTSATPIRASRCGPTHTSCRRARPGPDARSTACSVLGQCLTSQRRPRRGPEPRRRSSGPQQAQMS
jgi:hypothetical protein